MKKQAWETQCMEDGSYSDENIAMECVIHLLPDLGYRTILDPCLGAVKVSRETRRACFWRPTRAGGPNRAGSLTEEPLAFCNSLASGTKSYAVTFIVPKSSLLNTVILKGGELHLQSKQLSFLRRSEMPLARRASSETSEGRQ